MDVAENACYLDMLLMHIIERHNSLMMAILELNTFHHIATIEDGM